MKRSYLSFLAWWRLLQLGRLTEQLDSAAKRKKAASDELAAAISHEIYLKCLQDAAQQRAWRAKQAVDRYDLLAGLRL